MLSVKPYTRLAKDAIHKVCRWCGEGKALSEFSPSRQPQGNQRLVYRSNCKECAAAYARKWAREHVERASANKRRNDLSWQYGLTVADYDQLLASQGGVCAICGNGETVRRKGKLLRMPVDHDHQTDIVRGILCHRCNRAIGLIGDDPIILRRAIAYLMRHRTARKAG